MHGEPVMSPLHISSIVPIGDDGYDREQLAWAAGIFDGEGCTNTHLRQGNPDGLLYPNIKMVVTQHHDPEIIERFAAALKLGHISRRIVGQPSRPTVYIWVVSGQELVQASVALLWPWLASPKRRQAQQALRSWHDQRAVLKLRVGKKNRRAA
jgi:hypothetical protein